MTDNVTTKAIELAEKLEDFWGCYDGPEEPNELNAAAELRRLNGVEAAFNEWVEKTDWVQKSAHYSELGMHRADVLKARIDKLDALNKELVEALKKISAIEEQMYGPDWEEIQEAKRIAVAALAKAGEKS